MLRLGIDIGTTKSAAVICDSGKLLVHASCANNAGYGTQSTAKLLEATINAVCTLPENLRKQISSIGITGQMHGAVAWSRNECSDLENWQSELVIKNGALEKMKALPGCKNLASGFGFATLAVPEWRKDYSHAATIMDYFASLLADLENPVTEASNAASWGLWQNDVQDWNRTAVRALGIPEEILPGIVPAGTVIGKLCRKWADSLGLPSGIPVYVPIGDNPAAVIGSAGDIDTDIYLTVGTGAQMAFVPYENELKYCDGMEHRPFPGNRNLAVSATLCGGKSLELLAGFFQDILRKFDVDISMKKIYDKISEETASAGGLEVTTSFLGERHDPSRRGSIENINMENLRFSPLCRAWCEGILDGLFIPPEILKKRKRIVVNGNAIRRTPLFLQVICERFAGMEIVMPELCEEAACGAAEYIKILEK